MRKFFILCYFFFVFDVFAQDNFKLSSNSKDNFSIYLYAVQSELLGDIHAAEKLYDSSITRPDSSVYMPSLLSSINLRLASGNYGYETEKLLKLAYKNGADEKVLTDMMINFKLGKQEYSEAKRLCEKLLSSSKNNKRLLSVLALIDYSSQKSDSALIRINDFEAIYGIDPQLYSLKRELLSNMNLYDSLLSYNKRVSELFPENLSISADLANVYSAVGKDSLAYSLWKDIEKEDSTSIQFIASSNFFYSTHGFKVETIRTASKLISSPFIKTDAKQQIFSQVFISVDPSKDSSLFPMMDSLFYDSSLSEKDTCSVVREIISGYFFFRKDYSKCLDIISSLHRSLPSIPKYTIQIANILNLQNKLDLSFKVLDSAILASPHTTDYVVYKAELLKDNFGTKQCYSYIKHAIKSEKVDTSLSHYYSYLGDLDYKSGNVKKSFNCYELALKHNPDNTLALNNYAYFLALSDLNLDKALGMSHKCNILIDSNPTYLDTEAYILYKLGRFKDAKDLMDKAFSLLETDISDEMLLHYADILAAMGNSILARDYYKRALNAGADSSLITDRLNSLK